MYGPRKYSTPIRVSTSRAPSLHKHWRLLVFTSLEQISNLGISPTRRWYGWTFQPVSSAITMNLCWQTGWLGALPGTCIVCLLHFRLLIYCGSTSSPNVWVQYIFYPLFKIACFQCPLLPFTTLDQNCMWFVETNLAAVAQNQKQACNQHTATPSFTVGDPVWLSIPTAGNLDPMWEGEWVIKSVKSPMITAETPKLCIKIAYNTKMFQQTPCLWNPTQAMWKTKVGNLLQLTMFMSHLLLHLYLNAIHSDSIVHWTDMDFESWGQAWVKGGWM